VQQQARPKIKPVPNVPLILQMETIQGVEMQSQVTGVEYRYYVVYESEPSTLYLPPEGRDALLRAQPDIGDFIELLKQKASGRFVYLAARISDATDPKPQPPQPRWNGGGVRMLAGNRPQALPPRNGHNPDTGGDLTYAQAMQTYAPNDRPPQKWEDKQTHWEDLPDMDLRSQQPRRIAGPQPQPQAQAQPPRPEATDVHPIGQQLAGCFRAAVDAWEETRRYAQEKYGVDLKYTSEDIRASGLSVFIGQQRRGGN
jgi:hypothetical protein